MKPIYNLTDPTLNLDEWKTLSQASIENIPVPISFVISKEAFKMGLRNFDVNKQLKNAYAHLADGGDVNVNIYVYSAKGYQLNVSKKGFDNFIGKLNEIYDNLQVKRFDDDFSILIQPNITSECAGVLYSSEPETGLNNVCTIEALYGQELLFNNASQETDRYSVDKNQEIILDKFVTKQEVMSVMAANEDEMQKIEISPRWQSKQKLDDRHILMLMEIAKYLEENFEKDLEIYWIYEGGKLYILNIQKKLAHEKLKKVQEAEEFDLNKIIDEAPEIEIIESNENEVEDEIPVKNPSLYATTPKVQEEKIETKDDFIPQFLKSESEVEQEEKKERSISRSQKEPIIQKVETPIKTIDLIAKADPIAKPSLPMQAAYGPLKPAEKPKEVEDTNVEKKVTEEILLKGIGNLDIIIEGVATKDIKKGTDILVLTDLNNVSKKDVLKYKAFIIDTVLIDLPEFLTNKLIISATNLATKLIQENEYIKLDGKSGNIYEIQEEETKVDEPIVTQTISIEIEKVEQEIEMVPTENPIEEEVKEIKPQVENIPSIVTATKVFVKFKSGLTDSENISGYITSASDLDSSIKLSSTKPVIVQTTKDIEKESESIKKVRNNGAKNVWLTLPKTRKFSELEEYKSQISGIRRSSTFNVFAFISTPANAFSVEKYLEYPIDGLFIDTFKLKSSLNDDDESTEFSSLGSVLKECLTNISNKTKKKKKFSVFIDLDKFTINKQIVSTIFSLGYCNIICNASQLEKLKKLLAEEEKAKIIRHVKGKSK